MTLELSNEEASVLIAALTALERHTETFPSAALEALRPARSRLLATWLRSQLERPAAEESR